MNHHLLCADAAVRESAYGEVIPSSSHIVIDEAHQLEDVATQYFGISVSNYRLEELARDIERLLAGGRCRDERGELRHAIDRLRERSTRFFGALFLMREASDQRAHGRQDERFRLTTDLLVKQEKKPLC